MCFFFFFFKQKTAYEIPKRDWSSDVCSSDLESSRLHDEFESGRRDGWQHEVRKTLEVRGLLSVVANAQTPADVDVLQRIDAKTLQLVVQRHESLRTVSIRIDS